MEFGSTFTHVPARCSAGARPGWMIQRPSGGNVLALLIRTYPDGRDRSVFLFKRSSQEFIPPFISFPCPHSSDKSLEPNGETKAQIKDRSLTFQEHTTLEHCCQVPDRAYVSSTLPDSPSRVKQMLLWFGALILDLAKTRNV